MELEKISDGKDKESELKMLNKKMGELGVKITPKEEFDKKCQDYKKNWKELIDKEKE